MEHLTETQAACLKMQEEYKKEEKRPLNQYPVQSQEDYNSMISRLGKGKLTLRPNGAAMTTIGRSGEDRHLLKAIQIQIGEISQEALLMGTFDGHSGKDCSYFMEHFIENFLQQEFANYLNSPNLSDEEKDLAIANALQQAFINAHYTFIKYEQSFQSDLSHTCGSTASLSLVLDGKIYTANTGDSRTFYRDPIGNVRWLSWDHKPNLCKDDIEKRGGQVDEQENRVCDTSKKASLAVAKAIGDQSIPGINPRPSIQITPFQKGEGSYLISCSDGLADVLTPEEVFQLIDEMLEETPNISIGELTYRIIERAYYLCLNNEHGARYLLSLVKQNPSYAPDYYSRITTIIDDITLVIQKL